ncbi:hypothetical protein K1719_020993 [Acacia pycnantha]|nr:hypothetical protein K1719_020993 [Acacia pycnantha]
MQKWKTQKALQQQQLLLQHQQKQQQQLLLFQQMKQQQQQQPHQAQQAAAISRFPSNIDAHLRPMRSINLQQSPNANPNPHSNSNPIANVNQNPNLNHLQQQQQKIVRPTNQMELQMAYQDAWRVRHPDFKRPFSSLEDACERFTEVTAA